MTSAEYVNAKGWTPGTILVGGPIIRDGKVVEGQVRIKITAIGRDNVLCVRYSRGRWGRESSWVFDSREWGNE